MPPEFGELVRYFGIPGAMLAVALFFVYKAYQKALDDKETAYQLLLTKNDAAHQLVIAAKNEQIVVLREDYEKMRDGYVRLLGSLERQTHTQEQLVGAVRSAAEGLAASAATGAGGTG